MQKRIWLLIGLLLLALAATACGGAKPAATEAPAAAATEAPAAAAPTTAPVEPAQVAGYKCDDSLGCVEVADGDPILIASALVVSGPNAPLGLDTQYGAEIALKFRGEVLGHPL